MRTYKLLLTASLALLVPAVSAATDAPHDLSSYAGDCMACHRLHNAIGQSLTTQATLTDTCTTCHNNAANTVNPARLGFPWVTTDQATPGTSGTHHKWNADAVSQTYGTTLPTDPAMALRVIGGRLECSTCHNQHAANRQFAPSSLHASIPVGVGQVENNPTGGGTATLTLVSATGATVARGYRVRITGPGTLAVSHDNGVSWFRPGAPTGGTWTADPTGAGAAYTPGTAMTLDDPAVTINVSAGANTGDYWRFYLGYPFMRVNNGAGELCLTCHADRAQTHVDVESGGDGLRKFSHPVGQTLNANGKGYDRAVPLDADGGVPGVSGDANPTNDLRLGPTGTVGCTSCHAVHNADSNSLTADPR